MKRIFFAVALLLGMCAFLYSCEKAETENETKDSPLVGCWTWEDDNAIDEYLEFTETGLLNEFYTDDDYSNATYKDGVLYYSGTWKLSIIAKYWIEDNLLFVDEEGDIEVHPFEMVGKDRFYVIDKNNKIYFVRIKKFSK